MAPVLFFFLWEFLFSSFGDQLCVLVETASTLFFCFCFCFKISCAEEGQDEYEKDGFIVDDVDEEDEQDEEERADSDEERQKKKKRKKK